MTYTSLYVLTREFIEASERLIDLDLDEQTIADTLEGLSGTLEVKAINVAMFAKNLEASAKAITEAAKDQLARASALNKKAERLNDYLLACMKSAGILRIESQHFVIAIKKNPKKVVIDVESQIPDEFMRIPETPKPEPDKVFIKQALESGVNVSWAHIEQSDRLEVR